ncbi:MAG: hypothetical protein AAFX05_03865 [Planctomycetota bacterium]
MHNRTKSILGLCIAAACTLLAFGIFLWNARSSAPATASSDGQIAGHVQSDGQTIGTSWDPFSKAVPRRDRGDE